MVDIRDTISLNIYLVLLGSSVIAAYERYPRGHTLLISNIVLAEEFNEVFLLFVDSTGEEVEGDVGVCGRAKWIAQNHLNTGELAKDFGSLNE